MVRHGIVLGHIISSKGIEVDPTKLDGVSQLHYPSYAQEVRSFLGQVLEMVHSWFCMFLYMVWCNSPFFFLVFQF